MVEKNDLVIAHHELQPELPIGLQYFQAIDAMVEGVKKDNGYHNIQVYKVNEMQPSVIILRTTSTYRDGNIGKQDEIVLQSKTSRLQFNAETSADGQYVQYPQNLQPQSMEFLVETVNTFKSLAWEYGSQILINHQLQFVAVNGLWVKFVDDKNMHPPLSGYSQNGLSSGPEQNNLPGNKSTRIDFAYILNAILGLKKRQPHQTAGD